MLYTLLTDKIRLKRIYMSNTSKYSFFVVRQRLFIVKVIVVIGILGIINLHNGLTENIMGKCFIFGIFTTIQLENKPKFDIITNNFEPHMYVVVFRIELGVYFCKYFICRTIFWSAIDTFYQPFAFSKLIFNDIQTTVTPKSVHISSPRLFTNVTKRICKVLKDILIINGRRN